MAVGNLVTLEVKPDGLHIKLEPEGREYLESEIESKPGPDDDDKFYQWKRGTNFILWELLEPVICNSDWELLNPNSEDYVAIGALTDAPVLAEWVERNDDGDLTNIGDVYWFPNYMVESELETMMETGEVVFEKGERA
jgi:hypothetical protein